MKTLRNIFAIAVISIVSFASCTPENILDDQNPQQIRKDEIKVPTNG